MRPAGPCAWNSHPLKQAYPFRRRPYPEPLPQGSRRCSRADMVERAPWRRCFPLDLIDTILVFIILYVTRYDIPY